MQSRRNTVYLLLILCLLTGLFTGRAFFFNVAYMLSGLLLVSMLWSWFAVRWISIGRRTRSQRAQVGRFLEESFYVANRAYLPKLWLEILDHSDLPGHQASQVIPSLGARSRYTWNTRTLCLARGEFRLGPMTITSGDPFGLFLSQRRLEATSRVIVYPATVPIDRFDLPVGTLSGGEAQRRRTHYITTNAAGVRDYVPGDSFNRIHWRSTARKDRLVVKEFELDPLVDIWLFANFSRSSLYEHPNVQRIDGHGPIMPDRSGIPPSTEEYVAVIAASLARYFVGLERALGFAAYTPARTVYQPERGNRQMTRILEALAVARSFSDYTLEQMLTLETPYFTRGTTLIIITSSLNPDWITESQILNSRGIRTMCILVDAESMGADANTNNVYSRLRLAKIPTIVVRNRDDLTSVLEQRII